MLSIRRSAGLMRASLSNVAFRPFSVDHGIPTNKDQATGLERKEMEYLESHKHALTFGEDVLQRTHFGTEDKPIVVHTVHEERSVGCDGECKEGVNEGLRWWTMHVGQKYECPDCGQWFKLEKVAEEGHH